MSQILTLSITRMTEKIFVAYMIVVKDTIAMYEVLNEKVSVFVSQFIAAYNHLNDVYLKYDLRAYTEAVQEQDTKRVRAFRQMKDAIRYEFTYPQSDEKKGAAKVLLDIIDLYDLADISKLKMAEKTAALTNLIEDYEGKYAAQMETLGISALLAGLKAAQEEFMRVYLERNDIDSEFGLKAMADARTRMTEAYRDLVTAVNLAAKIDTSGELTPFINIMNVEIRKNFIHTGQSSNTKPNPDDEATELRDATAIFHFYDHREEEIRALVGSILNAPANTAGYYWDPAVPATMPAEDTSYYELPSEDSENSGNGTNNGGSGSNTGGGTELTPDDETNDELTAATGVTVKWTYNRAAVPEGSLLAKEMIVAPGTTIPASEWPEAHPGYHWNCTPEELNLSLPGKRPGEWYYVREQPDE